jgi:hypothetical protein
MGYDTADAQEQFDAIELDVFGEAVTFINGTTDVETAIQAVIYRQGREKSGLKGGNYSPARNKIQMLISRTDMSAIKKGVDKVRYLVEPDDENEKTMTIKDARPQFGVWKITVA